MTYSRKIFLKKLAGGFMITTGFLVVNSCNSSQKEKQAEPAEASSTKQAQPPNTSQEKDDCNDLSVLTEDELKVRQQFGYEQPSASPDRLCQNCSLYLVPSAEMPCAGCLLFKGHVSAEGSCIQFAAKVQQ